MYLDTRIFVPGALIVWVIVLTLNWSFDLSLSSHWSVGESPEDDTTPSIRSRHVAVCNTPYYHNDVYASLAWNVESIFKNRPEMNGTVTIYELKAENGYTQFMSDIGMSSVPVKKVADLLADMERTDLFGDDGEMIDTVLSGTCKDDMSALAGPLAEIWERRPADKKFKLGCVMHDAWTVKWIDAVEPFLRRQSFMFLYLSEHVQDFNVRRIYEWAGLPEHRRGGYEYIQTGIYVPVGNFTSLIVPKELDPPRALTKAAIQGTLEQSRRDYKGIFENLIESIEDDAAAWGYLPNTWDNLTAPYVPDLAASLPPFELHLLGGRGHVDIPSQLQNVVTIHWQLPSFEYYTVLQSMDVVLPAFATGHGYFTETASSTMHTALQVNVPLMVEKRVRRAYQFLDDSVTIMRPHALTEIDAIKALRTGIAPHVDPHTDPALAHDIDRMLAMGWRRPSGPFNEFKQRLWARNQEYILQLMS